MPRGDGTGPAGIGPMTGRAAGFCAGYQMPGYANSFGGGRGYGGFWHRGRGRGFRNRYWMSAYPLPAPTMSPQQELEGLKYQAEMLKDSMGQINQRIEQLQADSEK